MGSFYWRALLAAIVMLAALPASAGGIPATPVLTLYRFNADPTLPYYDVEQFARSGVAGAPAGHRPWNTGRRFSRNAATPSAKSRDAPARFCRAMTTTPVVNFWNILLMYPLIL